MRTVDKARMLIASSALHTTALRAVVRSILKGSCVRLEMALLGVLGSGRSVLL